MAIFCYFIFYFVLSFYFVFIVRVKSEENRESREDCLKRLFVSYLIFYFFSVFFNYFSF